MNPYLALAAQLAAGLAGHRGGSWSCPPPLQPVTPMRMTRQRHDACDTLRDAA